MSKKRYSLIIMRDVLKKIEEGNSVVSACNDYNISRSTFYRLKKKHPHLSMNISNRSDVRSALECLEDVYINLQLQTDGMIDTFVEHNHMMSAIQEKN